ncbi:MAG: hypothetical protein ACRD5F_03505 [Candidatus Acidiferrales bacterium]
MTWVSDVMEGLKRIVLVEERLDTLTKKCDALASLYDAINQRMARLEGKFELLERIGSVRTRRLPPQ